MDVDMWCTDLWGGGGMDVDMWCTDLWGGGGVSSLITVLLNLLLFPFLPQLLFLMCLNLFPLLCYSFIPLAAVTASAKFPGCVCPKV